MIELNRVWWIFSEIRARVGKVEALRLLGVSSNFWYRAENGVYLRCRRGTARRAVEVLADLRAHNVVRHKDSIRHGAAARGRAERIPTTRRDFYEGGAQATRWP